MVEKEPESSAFKELLARAEVGTGLTILSGLSFLFLCMVLPLVGKSGVQTEHATLNFSAFLGVLCLTLAVCGLAIKSKLDRSKVDGSPFPLFSTIIGALCVLLFFSLIFGLLKI